MEKCPRLIQRSKYERNDPEVANWWYKLYDRIEGDVAIPPDKRLEVLNEIFPSKLLQRILSILSIEGDVDNLSQIIAEKQAEMDHRGTLSDSLHASVSDQTEKNRKEVGRHNPYLQFFKRRPDRAAIWHTLPPLSLDEMNLLQKAEAITEMIATDFVVWMQNISDEDSPTSLTVQSVLKMFHIGFNTPAARSLQVRVKELASVPDGIALLKQKPEMSKRSQLHRQLQRDLGASQKPKKVYAFGTKISPDEQFHPPKTSEINKWLVCDRVPTKLASMAAVWQGITHLRSTRAYCEFLVSRPDIKPPKYLEDNRMLDPAMLKAPRRSGVDAGPVVSNATLFAREEKKQQRVSEEILMMV